MFVRSPVFAGSFYPEDSLVLKKMIQEFWKRSPIIKTKGEIKALIVPHAGYVYSGSVAAAGYKALSGQKFENIILLGPSHHFVFSNFVYPPVGWWETPLGKVPTLSLTDFPSVEYSELFQESAEIHQPEHCLEVQLPFLQMIFSDFKIFPLLVGNVIIDKASRALFSLLTRPRTLLIVSSDLSHYLSFAEAKKVDKVTLDAILAKDRERLEKYGEACGKVAIELLLEIAKKDDWEPQLVLALNSGETRGGRDRVVGYASVLFSKK